MGLVWRYGERAKRSPRSVELTEAWNKKLPSGFSSMRSTEGSRVVRGPPWCASDFRFISAGHRGVAGNNSGFFTS